MATPSTTRGTRGTSGPRGTAGSGSTRRGLRAYFHRANLLTSLVLIFPLFITYQLGIALLPDVGNGADLISGRIIHLLGDSKPNYLLFNLGLLAVFAIALAVMRGRQQFDMRLFVPVIVESGIYALAMGSVIVSLMGLIGISPQLLLHAAAAAAGTTATATAAAPGIATRIALSLGAGVHEELLFRLGMIPLFAWVGTKLMGMGRGVSLGVAFLVSSVLFSAAHHVIGGEAFAVSGEQASDVELVPCIGLGIKMEDRSRKKTAAPPRSDCELACPRRSWPAAAESAGHPRSLPCRVIGRGKLPSS